MDKLDKAQRMRDQSVADTTEMVALLGGQIELEADDLKHDPRFMFCGKAEHRSDARGSIGTLGVARAASADRTCVNLQ